MSANQGEWRITHTSNQADLFRRKTNWVGMTSWNHIGTYDTVDQAKGVARDIFVNEEKRRVKEVFFDPAVEFKQDAA